MSQDDVYDNIFGELTSLHLHWAMFRELFGHSEGRIKILNAASPIFGPVQGALLDNVLLFIARLFDAAKVCGKETISLRMAIEELSLPAPETAKLNSDLDSLRRFCDPIIQLRHRRISHNDRSILNGQQTLQAISRSDIQAAIDRADEFFRKLWAKKTCGGDVGFESPDQVDLPFWSEKLFTVLRDGLEKREFDRVARRDEYQRRYGVDTPDGFSPPPGSV